LEFINKEYNFFDGKKDKIILSKKKMIEMKKEYEEENGDVNGEKLSDEVLRKISKTQEHMLSFVTNVNELARMENGDIELIETATDLSDAVEKIYSLIEKDAKEKNITVEYWSDIFYPYIYQDVIHTTNVVMNILQNAIKYTPEGGKIRFGLRQSKNILENECNVSFICEDSGIGISPEFLPYICKSFAREDNEVNTEIPSAGLGLSIAKTLLYIMNGTIEVKSEPGKGTTVITDQPHLYARKEDVDKATTLAENLRR
jgi:signal transduction histidine kinase